MTKNWHGSEWGWMLAVAVLTAMDQPLGMAVGHRQGDGSGPHPLNDRLAL